MALPATRAWVGVRASRAALSSPRLPDPFPVRAEATGVVLGVEGLVKGAAYPPCQLRVAPVRQYALEKLEESGEASTVSRSHTEFFLALTERAHPEVLGERQVEWLERLEQENANLRVAMSWVLDAEDGATGARMG